MKTKVDSLNEAMQWTKGALNCYLAARVPGQEYIGGYVRSQVELARSLLQEARHLPRPMLP